MWRRRCSPPEGCECVDAEILVFGTIRCSCGEHAGEQDYCDVVVACRGVAETNMRVTVTQVKR